MKGGERMKRRDFLKSFLISSASFASILGFEGSSFSCEFPKGLIYTKDCPGRWKKKVKSHAPIVKIKGDEITIITNHPMSKRHYIVRHTLVTEKGDVIGERTFYPEDKKAESHFRIPKGYRGILFATSFCNLHDFWVTKFRI